MKENKTLFALCFVPVVCWIVCTVLRRQLELGRDLARISKTITSVYLLFLGNALSSLGAEGPHMREQLHKLCHLTCNGVLGCKAQSSERYLEHLELQGSDVQHFLIKKELPGVLGTEAIYPVHLSELPEVFCSTVLPAGG